MSDVPFFESSCVVYFDSLEAATLALLSVVLDARTTDTVYRFGGLSAAQILVSGLRLEGQIDEIAAKLEKIPGAIRQNT